MLWRKWDVGIIAISRAFIQAYMGGKIHMNMKGRLAELMVKLGPKIYSYLQNENGKSVMYVRLKNDLYGTLQAAQLFWKNLTTKRKSWGLTINPFDWYVANKMIKVMECMVL